MLKAADANGKSINEKADQMLEIRMGTPQDGYGNGEVALA